MATVTSSQKISRRVSIDDFIGGLRQLHEPDFTGVQGTLAYLRANPVDPESLQRYLFWDAQHYTRNLIDKTELYELLAICWEVGQRSSIHNHKGQNCWMAAPSGGLPCKTTACSLKIWRRIVATSCLPTWSRSLPNIRLRWTR